MRKAIIRKALTREIAFALWRAATKLDREYMVQVAKTLTRIVQNQGTTVQVEVSREMAQRLDDWSEPVRIQFKDRDGWQMYVRSLARIDEQAVAERAARQ